MLNRKMSIEEPAIPTKLLWHSWLIRFTYCKSCFLIISSWNDENFHSKSSGFCYTIIPFYWLWRKSSWAVIPLISLTRVTLCKEKLCRNLKFKRIWHLKNVILGIWAFSSWNQNSYFIFSVEIKVACQYLLCPPWLTMHIGCLWSGLEETEKLLCHKAEQSTGLIGCL